MTHFAEVSPEERDMIPYVMQPSPTNSIKIKNIPKQSNKLLNNKEQR